MTDLHIVDSKVFDEHLDRIEQVRTTFESELREGLRVCEDRLYLLRLSLESTEELLDEARRELSAALEDDEYRDSDRINRLIDEVDELTSECNRKRRAVEDGSAALRHLHDYTETAEHDFKEAAFRASVSMTENKVRYRAFVVEKMSATTQRRNPPPPVTNISTGDAGSAAAAPKVHIVPPVRAHDLPRLPVGMAWVPLEAIDWSSIDEDIEFKIASRSDIQTMMLTFVETIVPMLSVDPDIGVDRLAALDARRQRMPGDPDSLVGAWERLVSGSDQIALDTSLGEAHVSINSGRHRILAAQDIGMTHVPAIISQTKASRGEQK